jgi:hypothetical protein
MTDQIDQLKEDIATLEEAHKEGDRFLYHLADGKFLDPTIWLENALPALGRSLVLLKEHYEEEQHNEEWRAEYAAMQKDEERRERAHAIRAGRFD